ncbi:hypothetical protein GCM10010124_07160 [Pilimelia terevasa]|uniref:Uncharacterized protein n=1 Tax=Pilimelia terevasa TaxID=53372 RepID=A0A8J3BFA2_9ACTN|nr:hypothetical protein [Pilimelia terevasa]GGK17177.1 hypothetical protein GCM10010124_07160 [Pilimelia terevasa]
MTEMTPAQTAAALLADLGATDGTDRVALAQAWATLAVAEELAALRAQGGGIAAAVDRLDGTDSSIRQIVNTLHAMANRP